MASISFRLNGKPQTLDVDPDMPLLWALRDVVGLTGTKYGCGVAQCGACTVHLDGSPIRSCVTSVSEIAGKSVTTIEGISADRSHVIQQAWITEQVPQCGYCQSGQIMAAAALLAQKPKPTDADIDRAMSGNICRCGTYQRLRRAIHRAAGQAAPESKTTASAARRGAL
ncbi:MAG: (2Fe-2S)-binding protein [Candidatus Acidiferrales bacterium]